MLKSVGKPLTRKDSMWKVTGAATYTGDITFPNILRGKILRSPFPHARILSIDASRAEKLNGVLAVITHRNVPKTRYNAHASPPAPQDQRLLDSKVRYVGEPVAAVAAVDEETAELAIEKIDVDYEVLDAVFDPEEALRPDAPKIHDNESTHIQDIPRNLAKYMKVSYGDVEEAFRNAYFTWGPERFRSKAIHTSPLERPTCIAEYDKYGKITVYSPTQFTLLKRYWLSKVLDMPLNMVRVRVPYVGGAFGSKTELARYEAICATLAKMAKRPVRIDLTREEMLSGEGGRRHMSIIDLKLALNQQGYFVALQAKVVTGAGAYCPHGAGVTHNMINQFHSLYKFPNYSAEGYCAYMNTSWAGAFRGYGVTEPTFAIESSIEMIAEELKMDSIELRRKNYVKVGDTIPWSQNTIQTSGLDDCISLGMKEIGWQGRSRPDRRGSGAKRRGVGMSAITHHTSLGSGRSPLAPVVPVKGKDMALESANAFVRANEDGTFSVIVNCCEVGSGQHTTLAQIAAEALGVDFDRIYIDPLIDSDTAPYDLGPAIDRTTFVTGGAVKKAAEDARRQILATAAKILERDPEILQISAGRVFPKDSPEEGISLSDLAKLAESSYGMIMGKGHYVPISNAPSFGAEFSEVEVDAETGRVNVLRVVGVFDVGRIVNPVTAEGQVHGGIVQGLSGTLLEGLMTDPDSGATVNPNLADYNLARSGDTPEIKAIFVETNEPTSPYGVKGLGQIPIDGMSASLANAIYDAVGVRVRELPITAEKVLKELKGKRRFRGQR